jgi:hypothetical protein
MNESKQAMLPLKLTGELACILEDCGPPEMQSPEALAELIRHYQATWDRILSALSSTDRAAPPSVALDDEKLAEWSRNWHWNDCAEDKPVDPSIYFRDRRMLKAFVAEFGSDLTGPQPGGAVAGTEAHRSTLSKDATP